MRGIRRFGLSLALTLCVATAAYAQQSDPVIEQQIQAALKANPPRMDEVDGLLGGELTQDLSGVGGVTDCAAKTWVQGRQMPTADELMKICGPQLVKSLKDCEALMNTPGDDKHCWPMVSEAITKGSGL